MSVALVLRLALLARAWQVSASAYSSVPRAMLTGSFFDLLAGSWFLLPATLYLAVVPRRIHASRAHAILVAVGLAAGVFLTLFGSAAEWIYWDEFSARFDFIAVDYLVYTHEVIENIRESYPLPWIVALGVALTLASMYALRRTLIQAIKPDPTRSRSPLILAALVALPLADLALVRQSLAEFSPNRYVNEIAKNGPYSLFSAFRNNTLDYRTHYLAEPQDIAFARTRELLAEPGKEFDGTESSGLLHRTPGGVERRSNVVMIVVESLDAAFLGAFGSDKNLTPRLDALAEESLLFTRFFATGTRTVRGLEAITLSVPPTPGRSIVKRPGCEGLYSLAWPFRERGYDTRFLYGGYGYFDNMNHFFENNGFDVVDRTDLSDDEVRFSNAWGVCDQDILRRELAECDASAAAEKPFFHLVMTTSNHRPYTFPGVIDIPSGEGRYGAVKYTDFAIGEFFDEAKLRSWYADTLFVVVADHCASSAGREDVNLANYHIPLLVHAAWLQAERNDTFACQIDLAPTILGMLAFEHRDTWFGRDLLRDPSPRVLLGNYRTLGLFDGDRLALLKPGREVVTFAVDGDLVQTPMQPDSGLTADAIAYYQSASDLFGSGGLRRPWAPRTSP